MCKKPLTGFSQQEGEESCILAEERGVFDLVEWQGSGLCGQGPNRNLAASTLEGI